MRIHEKHANGASIEINFDLEKEIYGDTPRQERADNLLAYVKEWRESQPSPEQKADETEKGKSGASAYFSAEQDRTYDIDNGPWNYTPVIRAHSISLRVNEGPVA